MQPVYILLPALNNTHFVYNPLDRFLGAPMARIPDQVVERLKADIAVQRLAEARGVVF